MKKKLYIEIYNDLKRKIFDGTYAVGQKLPSKRTLADLYCVSTITAEHSLAMLCDEGYIEARQRSGYYVIYSDKEFFSSKIGYAKPPEAVLHITVDDSFHFPAFAKTIRKTLSIWDKAITSKCPNKGCIELRRELSAYLNRSRGIKVNEGQIIIGAGAEYLYGIILQMLGKDRKFAIENPSYEKIEFVYRANGIEYECLDLAKDGIKTSELQKTKASVLHITPYRSYPSLISASATKKREYLNWVTGNNRYLIEDDAESEFTTMHKPEETLFSLDKTGHTIYLNTFSKTIFPSIRTAYMVLPDELLETYESRVGFYSCTVALFEQYVISEYIKNGDFERHINRIRRQKRKNYNKNT